MAIFNARPYQETLIHHACELPRAGLWAGMGLGKTVSTLTTIDALRTVGELRRPVLVLAPLRVAQTTWPDEVKKWDHLSGLSVRPIVGKAAERINALRRGMREGAPIFTMNYENLPWLAEQLRDLKQPWPFEMVVADESTRLKSFRLSQGSVRAKAVAAVAHTHVKRWLNLTGTPAPNGLMDLWGQTWFLDRGQRLGQSFTAFRDRYFRPHPSGFGFLPYDFAEDDIHRRLKDLCVTIEDGLDLEEPIRTEVWVELPAPARARYREMEKQLWTELEGHAIEAAHGAARTMKCLQLANGAAYTDDEGKSWVEVHDQKVQALESIIEESAGRPVLVSYHFRSDLERLKRAFPQAKVLDTNPETIRHWNLGKIPVLLAHPASAGHGLNLQDGGHILVYFSVDWSLENHAQILERIGPARQKAAGYQRPVYVYYILARDTVDELVLRRLRSKRSVQDILMEAMLRR